MHGQPHIRFTNMIDTTLTKLRVVQTLPLALSCSKVQFVLMTPYCRVGLQFQAGNPSVPETSNQISASRLTILTTYLVFSTAPTGKCLDALFLPHPKYPAFLNHHANSHCWYYHKTSEVDTSMWIKCNQKRQWMSARTQWLLRECTLCEWVGEVVTRHLHCETGVAGELLRWTVASREFC